ncbi:MAG TPA: recombinase RecT [Phycisphaerae bacterium]|nr:recombinase RecT [Phycisphaerae bacterium]
MTQAQAQTQDMVDGASELARLLNKSAVYRRAPLSSEDKILGFMDIPDIRGMIEHAFEDDSLTDQQRTAKAQALVEQARVSLTNSPDRAKLLTCTTDSFIQTITGCASVDLSFTKVLGQAHIVRFGPAATLMVGYQGFVTLIMRTGVVVSIQVEAIYKGETYRLISGQPVYHERRLDIDRTDENIIGVYCEARNFSGPPTSVILNRQEMEKIRKTSKAKEGPWKYWEGEMWKKSAVRRLQKQLPKGSDEKANKELAKALEMDNRDFGLAAKEAEEGLREHGRAVFAKAKKTQVVDLPPEPKAIPKPKIVSAAACKKFRARIAKKRGGDSSLSDEQFVEVVCESVTGEKVLERLTVDQFRLVGEALGAGQFDWDNGERLPEEEPCTEPEQPMEIPDANAELDDTAS